MLFWIFEVSNYQFIQKSRHITNIIKSCIQCLWFFQYSVFHMKARFRNISLINFILVFWQSSKKCYLKPDIIKSLKQTCTASNSCKQRNCWLRFGLLVCEKHISSFQTAFLSVVNLILGIICNRIEFNKIMSI